MTIPASMPVRATYTGDGATVNFPIPFKYFANNDGTKQVKVYLADSDGGNQTELTENTDFTMTAAGAATGTLTMTTAPATGKRITVVYAIPIEQVTDWQEFGRLPSESIEDAADKLTAILKQQKEVLDRCVKVEISDPRTPEQVFTDFRTEIQNKVDAAAGSATNAASSATLAEQWATKTSGKVDSTNYSAKYYAIYAAGKADNAATSATNAATSESNAATSATNAATSATAAENSANIATTTANSLLANENVKRVAENINNVNTVADKANDIAKLSNNDVLGTIRLVAETISDYNADIIGGVAYTTDFGETICGGLNDTAEWEETLCGGVVDTVYDNVFEGDMKTITDNINDLRNVSQKADDIINAAEVVEADTAIVVSNTEEFSKRFDSQEFQDVANAAGNITSLAGTLGWVETVIHYLQYLGKIVHGGVATTTEWGETICGGLNDTAEWDDPVHGGIADTVF